MEDTAHWTPSSFYSCPISECGSSDCLYIQTFKGHLVSVLAGVGTSATTFAKAIPGSSACCCLSWTRGVDARFPHVSLAAWCPVAVLILKHLCWPRFDPGAQGSVAAYSACVAGLGAPHLFSAIIPNPCRLSSEACAEPTCPHCALLWQHEQPDASAGSSNTPAFPES